MSELKVYKISGIEFDSQFYHKSEADKVIAELKDKARHYPIMAALLESDKKEIAELKDKLQAADTQIENLITSASSIMLSQDRVTDNKCAELCHHKYKRCMAMAKMCKSEADAAFLRYNWDSGRYADVDFYEKWSEIWLALAEEPTWAKFLQLIHKEAK